MVATAPTGLVTFLFTDVEGSTRKWESDPDGMAASLALHDRIVREEVAMGNGHVFSTAGDAFAVAFSTVSDAVDTAARIQLRLGDADWAGPAISVRMGIHTGQAEERDGDYFGPVLNRAARIMSSGHGGQVLVSSVTAGAAPAITPISLVDLGAHRLADLTEPEHLFEVRHPDLPVVERPIRSRDARRDNLPDALTSFVGREGELTDLERLLSDNRLVSLTGVGGTGKSRLAIEAARRMASDLADGAWLIELAPVTDPALVMTTIGGTWGLRPGEGASITDVVTRYLWSRELLMIIDNCEHLINAAGETIRLLLDRCPGIRVLATSRESLGIPGETLLRVPSLTLATASGERPEAVRLFVDRARSVRPDFDPGPEDLADIERVCARIDGIPLGIELAAARLRSLSPSELADRLEHSFRILSGSAKTALPRQRTLDATIDWSYDLLEPVEQAMFRRLSVFTGGFDLAAAEAVCSGDPVERRAVVDHMDSLVDKSLVIPMYSGSATRYRMLEPVRQFAQERLSDTSEPELFQTAHARHFASLAAEESPGLRGPDQVSRIEALDADYDNIRSAFRTFSETGDPERHVSMSFDLFSYWMHRGMQLEGVEIGAAGLEAAGSDVDALERVKTWWTTAIMAAEATQPIGIDHARSGLEVAKRLGDPTAIGMMELALGAAIRHTTTDPEYLQHLLEGRRLLDESPDPHWWDPEWEQGLLNLLFAAYLPSTDARLHSHLLTARDIFEDLGDRALLAATLADGWHLYFSDDPELSATALADTRRACDIYAEIDSPLWYGHALYYLGILLRYEEEYDEAAGMLARGAELMETVGDLNCWAVASRFLAMCEARLGRSDSARERLIAIIDSLPALPMQEVASPRVMDAASEVLAEAGRHEDSARALGLAMGIHLPSIATPRTEEQETLRRRLAEALGEERVDELIGEGKSTDLAEGIQQTREALAATD